MIQLDRMWVNQPSTPQPNHAAHGKNVLVVRVDGELAELTGEVVNVWHVVGPVMCERMFLASLSPGWLGSDPSPAPIGDEDEDEAGTVDLSADWREHDGAHAQNRGD
jgi:hypothetical protein